MRALRNAVCHAASRRPPGSRTERGDRRAPRHAGGGVPAPGMSPRRSPRCRPARVRRRRPDAGTLSRTPRRAVARNRRPRFPLRRPRPCAQSRFHGRRRVFPGTRDRCEHRGLFDVSLADAAPAAGLPAGGTGESRPHRRLGPRLHVVSSVSRNPQARRSLSGCHRAQRSEPGAVSGPAASDRGRRSSGNTLRATTSRCWASAQPSAVSSPKPTTALRMPIRWPS